MTHSFTSIGRPQFLGLAAILLVCLLGFSSISYAQNIRYVKAEASGPGSGTISTDPSSDLQAMINEAAALVTETSNATVLVGAGLYTPTEGGDYDIHYTTFTIPQGVKVYGGYPDDFNINNRIMNPSSSTLSGFISVKDRILPPNKNGLEESPRVFHVVYFNAIRSSSGGKLVDKSAADELLDTRRLDGFVITGGNADGPSDGNTADSGGGGIFIDGYDGGMGKPTIANCTLINNSATRGGAMYNYGRYLGNANPYVLNCSFINNTATEGGGAIYNDGTYAYSSSEHGNASGEYTNCTFINNSVSGESAKGGAIYNDASEGGLSSPTIVNCNFSGNTALRGGAIYNLASLPEPSPERVADNKAAKEAAESEYGTSAPLIINSSFVSNSATGGESDRGGAIFNDGGNSGVVSATLVNCIFRDNSADFGGAIYLTDGATSSIVNSSFNKNHATYESEVSVGSAIYLHEDTRCSLVNCIFWSDGEAAANMFGFDSDSYGITSNHSLFQAGATTDIDPSQFTPAETDQFISSFPFVSDTNLQLANPSSNTAAAAAINTGNDAAYVGSYPTTDLAGLPRRFNNGVIDRGAFEYQASPVSQTGCADIIIIPVTNFAASGSLSCANPKVKLTASGTGSAFVVTGPNGYVFSNVYRYCDNHSVLAIDVNVPGTYTLKVYGGAELLSTHSVTVTGTACP